MTDIPENAVLRIDIYIDYASLNSQEIDVINGLINLGDLQLNAPCNRKLARIAELNRELAKLSPQQPRA